MTSSHDTDLDFACNVSFSHRAAEWRRTLPDVEKLCRRAAGAAIAAAGAEVVRPETAEISVVLGDDALIAEFNRTWRGSDGPTNVLAFPATDTQTAMPHPGGSAPLLLGDVVIAFETASGEARAEAKDLADHLSHLVVHGVLHLLGFDHQTDPEAVRMEELEIKVLDGLGIANPYRTGHVSVS